MTNTKDLTGVLWLANQLSVTDRAKYNGVIETARQMEKMQHGKTWDKSMDNLDARGGNIVRAWGDFDEYYNETYKGGEL
jgi:hypothetical protein